MTAFVIAGDRNFDTCYTAAGAVAAPSSNATLDTYTINGATLVIDTDTRYCPGRNGSVSSGGTGSVDTLTISAALGGNIVIDGTNVRVIPYVGGSGTPDNHSVGLYTSALTWASGEVTVTTSAVHSLSTGDFVSLGGAEPNGYNGIHQITVLSATQFKYELAANPGVSAVTNATAVKYRHCRQLQGAATAVTARTYGSSEVVYTATGHDLAADDWVLLAGITPNAHNGCFKVVSTTVDSITVARTVDPGAITVSGTVQKVAQGFFLGFWSALNVAANPQGTTGAAAISAAGFLKIKGLRGAFVPGATVTVQAAVSTTVVAAAADQVGWIEVVGQTTGIITVPRLGQFIATGAWLAPLLVPQVTTGTTWSANVVTLTFAAAHGITVGSRVTVSGATVSPAINGTWVVASVPTTSTLTFALSGSGGADTVVHTLTEVCASGAANQTIQLPASTVLTYYAGVWIETAVGSDAYEFWASAGSYATSGIHTSEERGRVCWISTQGLLRLGHDGTQANGATPTIGRRIRVPNINLVNATRAATPGTGPNVANTVTLTARQTFTSGGTNTGSVNIDTVNSNWYLNFVQTSLLTLSRVGVTEGVTLSELSQPYTFNNVCVGQSGALVSTALSQTLCFAGGTETDCVWTRCTLATSGAYVVLRSTVIGLTSYRERTFSIAARGAATTGSVTLTRVDNSTFIDATPLSGGYLFTTCANTKMLATKYADSIHQNAVTSYAQYAFTCAASCSQLTFDGLTLVGGLATAAPYSGLLYTVSGCVGIKMRNIGSTTAPLDLGSRAAYLFVSGTGTSGGCRDIELKRIYCANTLTGLYSADNSLSGLIMENVWGDEADTVTVNVLNAQIKGVRGAAVTTGQAAVYGSHVQDFVYSSNNTGKIALTFNEPTSAQPSVVTATAQQLALPSGYNSAGVVQMPNVGDEITIETQYRLLGHTGFTVAAPTYVSTTALTVTAGSWSANYTTLTVGTHTLVAGDTVVITGAVPAAYNGVFVITNVVSATQIRYYQATTPGTWSSGGNILQLDNINTFYCIDVGSGFGAQRNLRYVRTGGATTNLSTIITLTDTTGVEVGDYVTSKVAGVGTSARVVSIDSSTQVTVDVASSATTAANVFYFNHLPFETSIPTTGFKLRVVLKTWAACTTAAVTNIAIPTTTSAASRNLQYPLDTAALTITGLPEGTEVRLRQGSYTLDQRQDVVGGTYVYDYEASNKPFRAQFTLPGYVFEDMNLVFQAQGVTVPAVFSPDPSYSID